MSVTCKMCGASNETDANVCTACGTQLAGKSDSTGTASGKGAAKKTMLFAKAPQIPASNEASPVSSLSPSIPMVKMATPKPVTGSADRQASDTPVSDAKKTMLGAPAVQVPSSADTGSSDRSVAGASSPQRSGSPKNAKKTMVGTPAVELPADQNSATASSAPPPKASEAPRRVPDKSKTMFGMPAMSNRDIEKAVSDAKSVSQTPQPEMPSASAESTASPGSEGDAETPDTNRVPPPRGARMPTPILSRPKELEDLINGTTRPPRSKGMIIGVIAILVVVIAMLVAIIVKLASDESRQLIPSISQSADGTILTVEVVLSDPPAGTVVMVEGRADAIPVSGNKASFTLERDALSLGNNTIKLTQKTPDGTTRPMSITINLRHKAINDLSTLDGRDGGVRVAFELADGWTIQIDGKDCAIDGDRCTHLVPVDVLHKRRKENARQVRYVLPFTLVSADGTTETGQHLIVVPVTHLQLNRPAVSAVVEDSELTIEGITDEGAAVDVDGEDVPVSETLFSTTVPLETIGRHRFVVTAHAPQKLFAAREIRVNRVQSLTPFVKTWSKDVDKSFDYAKLSRNPDAHKGKKIILSGRIINISTVKGITAFLLYVNKGCPTGGQCGLYVVFKGETGAGLQSMVTLYGTVQGTREVPMDDDEKKSLPALEAQYVVESTTGTPSTR